MKARSQMKQPLALLLAILIGAPANAGEKALALECIFTSAASVYETGFGQTRLENYSLPAAFFADFSLNVTDDALTDVTIARWSSFSAQSSVGLLKPQVCRNDKVTITCTGHFGDTLFIDQKTLKGSAIIPEKSGYAGEVVVSFFRCNKVE